MAAPRHKPGRVPLERALSKLRIASRREVRQLIHDGRVTVNGRVVTDPLAPVVPERVAIARDRHAASAPPWRTIERSRRETHLIVELTEGKNREIRRLIADLSRRSARGAKADVTRLLRVAYGPIELGTLQPGRWREISVAEIARL